MVIDIVTGEEFTNKNFKILHSQRHYALFKKTKPAKHTCFRYLRKEKYSELVKILVDNFGKEYPVVSAKTMIHYLGETVKWRKFYDVLESSNCSTKIGDLTFYLKGADTVSIKESQRAKQSKEKTSARWKQYMSDPIKKAAHLEKNKLWRKVNKDRSREYLRVYRSKRKKSDIDYRIRTNTRNRIRKALLQSGSGKCAKTEELIGMKLNDYRNYLEGKFTKGMSWDNYGEWEIDHVIPCSSFDLVDPSQQRACFHFSNTQPLWKIDNMKKGSKLKN